MYRERETYVYIYLYRYIYIYIYISVAIMAPSSFSRQKASSGWPRRLLTPMVSLRVVGIYSSSVLRFRVLSFRISWIRV